MHRLLIQILFQLFIALLVFELTSCRDYVDPQTVKPHPTSNTINPSKKPKADQSNLEQSNPKSENSPEGENKNTKSTNQQTTFPENVCTAVWEKISVCLVVKWLEMPYQGNPGSF